MQRQRVETNPKIMAVNNKDLVVLESLVNQETQKLDASNNGMRRMTQIRVYHQWRYSLRKQKKYQRNRMIVTTTVIIAIEVAPHLIGIQRQHV
jgi:hypothetical protein